MSPIPTFGPGASISISNAARRVVLTSDGHLELLGRSKSEVVGHNWQEWMTTEDFRAVTQPFQQFLANRKPYQIVSHVVRQDGRVIPIVAQCSSIEGSTPEDTLLFCQMLALDESAMRAQAAQLACAEYVRDMTYELAALTGRHRLTDLTRALIETSASADHAVEVLSRVVEAVKA